MHKKTSSSSRPLRIAVIVAIALAAGLIAARTLIPARPAVVAVVNLERVFNMSYRWANERAELETLRKALDAELSARQDEVRRLDEEMSAFQAGSAAAVKLQPEVNQAISDFSAFRQFASLRLEAARAKALRTTYEEIQAIARGFAGKNGIDIVIVDDSIPQMSRGNAASTIQQISARRVLFATSEFDITQELLVAFNTLYPLNPGVTEPSEDENALDAAAHKPEQRPGASASAPTGAP